MNTVKVWYHNGTKLILIDLPKTDKSKLIMKQNGDWVSASELFKGESK